MKTDYLDGIDEELKEITYQVGVDALQAGRWKEAVAAFQELLDENSSYRDVRDKLKEAKFRQRWALILDPLDSIRPRWLNLWQFIGLIFGVGVILITTTLFLTGVGGAVLFGP